MSVTHDAMTDTKRAVVKWNRVDGDLLINYGTVKYDVPEEKASEWLAGLKAHISDEISKSQEYEQQLISAMEASLTAKIEKAAAESRKSNTAITSKTIENEISDVGFDELIECLDKVADSDSDGQTLKNVLSAFISDCANQTESLRKQADENKKEIIHSIDLNAKSTQRLMIGIAVIVVLAVVIVPSLSKLEGKSLWITVGVLIATLIAAVVIIAAIGKKRKNNEAHGETKKRANRRYATTGSKKLFYGAVSMAVASAVMLIVDLLYSFLAPYIIELVTILLTAFGSASLLTAIILFVKSPYKPKAYNKDTGFSFIKNSTAVKVLWIILCVSALLYLVFAILSSVCGFYFAKICWYVFGSIFLIIGILLYGKSFFCYAILIGVCAAPCIMLSFIGVLRFDFDGYKYGDIFYDITGVGSVSITGVDKDAAVGEFSIPDRINGRRVTVINNSVFKDCDELTKVILPDGLEFISYCLFENCSSLKDVILPDSITTIGYSVFENCSSLTGVTIPNSVTSISDCAFRGCSGLTSITIPNSVTSIGIEAFSGSGLTSITIPNSVTSIEWSAFEGCSGLTSITIPNSMTSIESFAFNGCSGLTSITIPNSMTSIGGYAFYGCSGLTSITYTGTLAEWCGISGLNSLMDYGKSNKTLIIDGAEVKGDLVIPDGVTSIGWGAFEGCSGLTSVTIPNGLTSIEWSAFEGCSGLTSITIPNSVTSIWNWSFNGCRGLTSITFSGTMEQWKAVSKDGKWDRDTGNYTIHCTDGDLAKE